jgi:glycerol uptake facilitator-like aquaporin
MSRKLAAEFLGTAALLAMVVGSGIAGERLAGGNVALALLVNAVSSATGLVVLILAFGPVSGAHFNPAVSLSQAMSGALRWRALPAYVLAQVSGAVVGVVAAHAMFGEVLLETSSHVRTGHALWWSELIATVGLVLTIAAVSRSRTGAVPYAVGLYIVSAYFFTASTSFANPAVTLARSLTDTFSGIRPADAPMFIVVQLGGAAVATVLAGWLWPTQVKSRPVVRALAEA